MNRMGILVLALVVGAGFVGGSALAATSNMQSALEHLQAARNDLEQGGKAKGHQKSALQLVDQAIEHVRKGIDEEQKKEGKATKQEQKQQEKTTDQKKTKK